MFFTDTTSVEILLQCVINTKTMSADSRAMDEGKTTIVLWFCELQFADSSPSYLESIV